MVALWNVDVKIGEYPQKVATALAGLSEKLTGAEYTPIAYIGTQEVNGINHAILAEQLLTTGKDTKNIVLLIFNEKGMDCNLVAIERVVSGGGALGGVNIEVRTQIPEEAQKAYDAAFEGYVGGDFKPVVYLGTQITNGVNYLFGVECDPVVKDPHKEFYIISVNKLTGKVAIKQILSDDFDTHPFGYAFSC